MTFVYLISIALIFICVWAIKLSINKYLDVVQFNYNQIDKELQESKLREKQMQAEIENLRIDCQAIKMDVQMMRPIRKPSVEVQDVKIEKAANRKPRTDAQKKLASEQRKKWWDEKRKREENNRYLPPSSMATQQLRELLVAEQTST